MWKFTFFTVIIRNICSTFSKDYSYFSILYRFLKIIPCLAYISDVTKKNNAILVPVKPISNLKQCTTSRNKTKMLKISKSLRPNTANKVSCLRNFYWSHWFLFIRYSEIKAKIYHFLKRKVCYNVHKWIVFICQYRLEKIQVKITNL